MKIDWNKKYTTISVYAFLVVCCSILFFSVVSEVEAWAKQIGEYISIFQPFLIGFVIAYILNFILKFYEEKILSINQLNKVKSKRAISIILTYLTAGIIIYLLTQFVIPQLIDSLVGLANDIPKYVTNITMLADELSKELDIREEYIVFVKGKFDEMVAFIIGIGANLIPLLGNFVMSIASSIWNIALGLIISIYMLIDKEKFFGLGKKIIYAFFNEENSRYILKLAYRTNNTFGNFLGGKILDSAIIGALTFIVLTAFKMPYTILISVIIGVTNIIPFFGPLLGAIPSAIIILFVSPIKAIWFIVIVIIIQQIDGNIIGPKILGDSIGIGAFWILFSVLVAGKLFGLVGMIIGVPVFAVVYFTIKDLVEDRLKKKGLSYRTKDYMN
jgi:predicted PurR-regulated permease PerM